MSGISHSVEGACAKSTTPVDTIIQRVLQADWVAATALQRLVFTNESVWFEEGPARPWSVPQFVS